MFFLLGQKQFKRIQREADQNSSSFDSEDLSDAATQREERQRRRLRDQLRAGGPLTPRKHSNRERLPVGPMFDKVYQAVRASDTRLIAGVKEITGTVVANASQFQNNETIRIFGELSRCVGLFVVSVRFEQNCTFSGAVTGGYG